MKTVKFLKKFLSLTLVLFLCIESFAAVVADNDGSAFITKAEFDSLKNNFQSQIDQYNTSVDSKIDGAIAAYLAGIRVTTKDTIVPLVEKYQDIYWCHDFSIEAKTKKWTSRTNSTITNTATVQPNFDNQNGWTYWRKDRGARFGLIFPSNFGVATAGARLAFQSDGTYTKTTTDNPNNADTYVCPILTLKVVGDNIIDTNPLINFYECQYNMFRFGLDHQSNVSMNITQGVRDIEVTPINAASADEYFRIKLTQVQASGNISHTQIWNNKNTYAFSALTTDFSTTVPGRNATTLESERLTFPLYSYFADSDALVAANQERIYNMMLGTRPAYRIPFLYDYKLGGPSGQVTTGYESTSGISIYSFCDWSRWATRPIAATFTMGRLVGANAGGGNPLYEQNVTITSTDVTINVPVVTRFYVRDLKSPIAIYKNENLNVCGGIPILAEAQKAGTLKVKIKSEKAYDDPSKGSIANANAHIKFKKTTFTDTLTNYASGTYGSTETSATFDGSQTINIKEETFKLNVNKGEDIWLNIDPITLGQHIKITSLECEFEYE